MEAYRELFAIADGESLLKLLEKKPEFPYDDDIVQVIGGRTDLGDHADTLLNVFAKKKAAIRQQNDVFDFAVTRDDEKGSGYCIEYFKKYNGFYLRRRYDLFAVNDRMTRPSDLAPAALFVRAIEETPCDTAVYHKLSDHKPRPITHKDLESLLSSKRTRLNPEVQKFEFFVHSQPDSNKSYFLPVARPYTLKDIGNNFSNRGLQSISYSYNTLKAPQIFCDPRSGAKIASVSAYLKQQGVDYVQPMPFSFYLLQLISAKLVD